MPSTSRERGWAGPVGEQPLAAAEHDRVMFCGEDAALPAADVERYAAAGASAFLAAYGRHRPSGTRTS